MDNNVVLTLRMEQLDSEDGEGIINTYPAKYRKVGDWHVFSYEETVSSDPGDRTKNLLKIRDEEVILIKKGTINSTMEFAMMMFSAVFMTHLTELCKWCSTPVWYR